MNKGIPAVLFDVDGTLVDTNYLHTMAWWRAFRDVGQQVASSRVPRHIGMGSEELMEALVGRSGWRELKEAHRRRLEELKPEIVAFPKAASSCGRWLLAACTSSSPPRPTSGTSMP